MNKSMVKTITITGSFVFRPLNAISLSRAICRARHVVNREQLLGALWWIKTLSEQEVSSSDRPDSHGAAEKSRIRSINKHLHLAIDPEKQGGEVELDFILFKHNDHFSDESGYRQAMDVLKRHGYMSPKTAWFLSFVLQMPEDLCSFPIVSPVSLDSEGQNLYPCYSPSAPSKGRGQLGFDSNEGDYCSDYELISMNLGHMFGVRPRA